MTIGARTPRTSSMGSILAVDHDRSILYVNDAEEPEGIMAFSLSTGSGSGCCRRGKAMARTNSPRVIRRGPGGTDEGIGPNVVESHVLMARDREESSAIRDPIWSARIACTDDAAYVAMNYPEGPDTVFAYHRNGEEGRLPVPTEFTEDLRQRKGERELGRTTERTTQLLLVVTRKRGHDPAPQLDATRSTISSIVKHGVLECMTRWQLAQTSAMSSTTVTLSGCSWAIGVL